ncbi:uncharacterized protein A1O5_12014 [Cladophialophora psammophila CBS 110553]|uniref:C2H2-type domain-containing protein n=1 Tax=Cladophialophora psammophila CBS 110553 TaxID=1182543 RepID=W9VZF9_9EURO|nr:uncharacterized protein A1O5_12014 [Cladophialophora psammophila CBS 110553]EXJ61222.1 hypothetical protein A1O5_12014 [Cladophialophora psammophila CBS 110553]
MSQDQDPYFQFERDIIGPLRSPVLEPVNPEYGPRASPAPLVPVNDPSSSDSSDVEDPKAVRRQGNPRIRKSRANCTFADSVLILSLDPNQRILASQARKRPLDSRSQSAAEEEEEGEEEEEEGEEGEQDDEHDGHSDDNGIQAGHREIRRATRVIRNGPNRVSIKTKPAARTALHPDPDGRDDDDDDDDDFPMIDSPATVAEDDLVRSPPQPTHDMHKPEQAQAFHAPTKQAADLSRKQFNTIPPPRTRPLFSNLRLNLAPAIRDGNQVDDSILKSPILGKYAISPRDGHPDFTLPAMQQRSPPRSSPAALLGYRMTLPPLKIAIGDLHDSSMGGFPCLSPGMARPSPNQFASYASPASYAAYSAMSPPDPPLQSNWRTTTRDSNTSTFSDYTSSTSVSVSTPASSIITPSPAASGPSSLTALAEQDLEDGEGEESRMQQVLTKETDLRSYAEVRSRPQPQPEARPKARPKPSARLKLQQLQRAARSKPRPTQPAAQSKAQLQPVLEPAPQPSAPLKVQPQPTLECPPQPAARSKPRPPQPAAQSKPQAHPDLELPPRPESRTEAESAAGSETESELSELTELESELGSEPEPEHRSRPHTKRPSVSQSKPQPEASSDAAALARFSLGPYKCTFEGCTAAPFHTQYLLNSHMNVHSNTRTHFCPIKDCPRGPGGLGFKRKNEMIRHGLVHTSPGYICPFCPDQQHKYPRPDNLQRHVRQHHANEDRHDPRLREVLDQRTDGSSKAGKRRMRLF